MVRTRALDAAARSESAVLEERRLDRLVKGCALDPNEVPDSIVVCDGRDANKLAGVTRQQSLVMLMRASKYGDPPGARGKLDSPAHLAARAPTI